MHIFNLGVEGIKFNVRWLRRLRVQDCPDTLPETQPSLILVHRDSSEAVREAADEFNICDTGNCYALGLSLAILTNDRKGTTERSGRLHLLGYPVPDNNCRLYPECGQERETALRFERFLVNAAANESPSWQLLYNERVTDGGRPTPRTSVSASATASRIGHRILDNVVLSCGRDALGKVLQEGRIIDFVRLESELQVLEDNLKSPGSQKGARLVEVARASRPRVEEFVQLRATFIEALRAFKNGGSEREHDAVINTGWKLRRWLNAQRDRWNT